MLLTRARRAMGVWTLVIAVVVVAITVYRVLDHYDLLPSYVCPARPTYREAVSAEARAQIDALFDRGLLYCSTIEAGLARVDPTIYWGTDGTRSVLFFQARPGADLRGVGVSEYLFEDRDVPGPIGDGSMYGFRLEDFGQPVWRNQARDDVPTWFFRADGAPPDYDVSVQVKIVGEAEEQTGTTRRDFMRDLEYLWDYVRGDIPSDGVRNMRRAWSVPIQPRRWLATRHDELNPALADERGRYDPGRLATADLPRPALLQTVHGLLGSTVWVAGVVSGTRPVLVLAPPDAGADAPVLDPVASGRWVSALGPNRLAHFAFPPQAAGRLHEARYWHDAAARGARPPDLTWPVTFNPPPPPGAASP